MSEFHSLAVLTTFYNAKVRRAADIMRAESSQAIGREDRPLSSLPNERKKKNQTKIQDHVEVFIPSREDSTRFKPARKVSQVNHGDGLDLRTCHSTVWSVAVPPSLIVCIVPDFRFTFLSN